ncbi:3-isopropylmalate dehydrogenase [Lacibacter luteus]|uniref:3-isopropylmalate dehydrogenase n=1 Tax=Lacibacter luteus TaxID=2508719 RepID=A0A4Q1CE83_9BACT|nr:3-isopropylmalate dehydrogenase [Lacibacter luteus]RXK57772.1 3-isopropylmalate dehydrogenase [Lacibacter luteus]
MEKKIAILNGDGIGPEVTAQSIKVLNAIAQEYGHVFHFREALVGADAIEKTGTALPSETIDICLDSDAVLFGAVGHPKYDNDPTAKVRPEQGLFGIRKALGLFANIRPVITYSGLQHLSPFKASHLEGVDLVIFRELTGGIYFGEKYTSEDGNKASDECVYTRPEIERIAHLAFKLAQGRKKKVTLFDKSNVLETSRLWRKVVQEIATQYPDVTAEYMYVDNAAVQVILNPKQFDVILTENMFGDIISDEASVLNGSMGMLPSASVGNGTALFEPIHGTFPKAAGKDIANPIGSILSTALMLEYFGLKEEAQIIRDAIDWTLQHNFVTKDIDPMNFYFTSTIGDLVSEYVAGKIPGTIKKENIELRKSTII